MYGVYPSKAVTEIIGFEFEFEFEFDSINDMVLNDTKVKIVLYDAMGYEMNPTDPFTVEIGIVGIDLSKVEIVFYSIMNGEIFILSFICNGMASVVNNLIETLLLRSILDVLAIIYYAIGINLAKTNKIGCINDNGSNVTMMVVDVCQTDCDEFEMEFFFTVIYFIMQIMDASLLNITVSIKFALFIIAMVQLESNLGVLSKIGAIDCDTVLTHIVCYAFYFVCLFLYFLSLQMSHLVSKYKTINKQHNVNDNKQFKNNLMEQFIQFLSILMVLNVSHQIISMQVYEPVTMSQTMLMFVERLRIMLLCVFNGVASIIDNLIAVAPSTSILDALTVIHNAIGVNLCKINQFGCVNGNVIDICEAVDGIHRIRLFSSVIPFVTQVFDAIACHCIKIKSIIITK